MNIVIYGIRGIPANYGGFETCVEETAQRYVTDGHHVTVYCRYYQYKEHIPVYKGINLIYIKSIPTKSIDTISHMFLSALHLIFKMKNIDCIHMYNPASALFIPFIKLFKRKTKIVVTVDGVEWNRDNWGFIAKNMLKFTMNLTTKVADQVVCDSQIVKDYFKEQFHYDMNYIPYGAKILEETDDSYKKFRLESKKYLLFVGRLVPEKGVHNLIEIYKKLRTNYPLVIIGDNPDNKEYVNSLKQTANGYNIIFLGYQYGATYNSILKNALIYVSASMVEGTSPSLLAAMGAKVCALVNGIPENLETTGGDSTAYFKENNMTDFLNKFQDLIDSPDKIEIYAKKGYERVKSVYNWDSIAQNYIQLYKR